MTSLLIQLPVPDPSAQTARSNVPLAAGYLAAAAPPGQVQILPRHLADHGGDAAILSWILSRSPAVVGFTAYLWNIQRSLWLAREIRAREPRIRTVFGGPEMAGGHPLVRWASGSHTCPGEDGWIHAGGHVAGAVDSVVEGEGEESFAPLVALALGNRELPRHVAASAPIDLSGVTNPYLQGTIACRPGDSLFLETVRGCLGRCSYCYYGKNGPGLRAFPLPRIVEVFEYARERGAADIYIMDPCFTHVVDARAKLEIMARANRSRIPLHTELELEDVTPDVAELLELAGFRSAEVGLQSTNPEALRRVHRGFRPRAFLRGAKLLTDRQIRIRCGIILGLPGDTMDGFLHTVQFVRDAGLGAGVELYPLSVLPGTELRGRASEVGIRHMSHPPYWVLSNGAMDQTDMMDAIEHAEAALDLEFFPAVLPSFPTQAGASDGPGACKRLGPVDSPIGFADLRPPDATERLIAQILRVAANLTLVVDGVRPRHPQQLRALAHELRQRTPHTLVQIVVAQDELPDYGSWDRAAGDFLVPGHYFNQIHYYARDIQERHSVRLYHLTADPRVARRYYSKPLPFDLLVRYTPGLLVRAPDLLERLPPLQVSSEVRPEERDALQRLYSATPSMLIPGDVTDPGALPGPAVLQ